MMALSAPTTPRATPKKPRNFILHPPQTPECFNSVSVETPVSSNKRRSNNDKFDEISNLKVAVRVRPMNLRELNVVGATDIVKVDNQNLVISTSSTTNYNLNTNHVFQYDYLFWSCDETKLQYSSQEDIFNRIGKPLLKSAFCGYNACLFAYGQTGSGKSYSMMGRSMDCLDIDSESGITPRFCKELFERLENLPSNSSATVEISYFEIYNEKIHDLLNNNMHNKQPLKVREHPIWGPYVVDLTTYIAKSYKELRNWMIVGNKNRATAATLMNEKSSRSHSIFSIELNLLEGTGDDGTGRRSKVSLVDLAGSERLYNTGNNEERIRQGVSINKSLLTLGKVISALAEQRKNQQFVPYRDSVLTWLLRESLGGNSLTCMLATITPASCNIDETLATLRYACQARSIVNRARINENPHDRLIRELRAEVDRLRSLRQDYEKNSFANNSLQLEDDREKEMDDLRKRLTETEGELRVAETCWQKRFLESREIQMRELAEAETRKEELESHLRIMKSKDNDVNLSPYKTNFLEQLENVLTNDETATKKLKKIDVKQSMNQIYNIMASFQPHLGGETDQLLFAKINKLLQALETSLNNSICEKAKSQKMVTFKF